MSKPQTLDLNNKGPMGIKTTQLTLWRSIRVWKIKEVVKTCVLL